MANREALAFADPLRRYANRELLKYAAGANIECPKCGDILDCSSTVLLSDIADDGTIRGQQTLCAKCYGRPAGSFEAGSIEVVDGRDTFAQKSKLVWRYARIK